MFRKELFRQGSEHGKRVQAAAGFKKVVQFPEKVIQKSGKGNTKTMVKGVMSMAEVRTQPDAAKVFAAIAMIMSHREDGTKVTLTDVRKKNEEKKSA